MKVQYDIKDVEIDSKKTLYEGFFTFSEYHCRFKRFDGSWSREMVREILEPGASVGLLPYDPRLKKILLVEQVRMGALEDPVSPWLLEVVAGRIDKSVSAETIAIQEAKEEAGIVIDRLVPMLSYWASPGCISERIHLFLGETDLSQAGGVHGLPEETEDIRSHVIDVSEIKSLIGQGRVSNAITLIALQWFLLNNPSFGS